MCLDLAQLEYFEIKSSPVVTPGQGQYQISNIFTEYFSREYLRQEGGLYVCLTVGLLTLDVKVGLAEELPQVVEDTLVAARVLRHWVPNDEGVGASTLANLILVSIAADLKEYKMRGGQEDRGETHPVFEHPLGCLLWVCQLGCEGYLVCGPLLYELGSRNVCPV